MDIFDLMNVKAQGYENRGVNVIYQNDQFKVRVIVLEAGGNAGWKPMSCFIV